MALAAGASVRLSVFRMLLLSSFWARPARFLILFLFCTCMFAVLWCSFDFGTFWMLGIVGFACFDLLVALLWLFWVRFWFVVVIVLGLSLRVLVCWFAGTCDLTLCVGLV